MPTSFDDILALGDNQVNFDSLVRQLRTGGVVPFVGAGMSVPYGMPAWRDFLVSMAGEAAWREEVDRLLGAGDYEEAAEIVLTRRGGNAFQDRLQYTFGADALTRLGALPKGAAVQHVAWLCDTVVLTTNFDSVLERIFSDAGRPFADVVTPGRMDQLARATHEQRRTLVHLHGLADDRSDRVLTRSEYENRYGAHTPLAPVLRAFMVRPLLFLGCSLQNDRPVRALLHLAQELRESGAEALLRHYALLEYPRDPNVRAMRLAELERMGVRPVWFPTGDFGAIHDILDRLVALRSGTGGDAPLASYATALLSTFRLEGTGLALEGASAHAEALSHAYAGMRYKIERDTLSMERLVDTRRRLVLLGEPGSGKSVTLKRALAFLSKRSGLVPARVSLADFAMEHAARRQIEPEHFFNAIAANAASLGTSQLDGRAVDRLFRSDRMAIVLDGFDEIGGRSLRERVATAIGRLSELTPTGRIFVASRPSEYRATPLPRPTVAEIPSFTEAEALPLESDQVRALLRESFGDDGRLFTAIRSDPRLLALSRTPLFITILALVARRGPLPRPPIAVFDAIVDTALESWEQQKGGAPAAALRSTLETLALFLHRRESPGAAIAESEAIAVMGENAAATIDFLVHRTGLLTRSVQRGAKSVRSTVQLAHLQLQEFLAACALARLFESRHEEATGVLRQWGEWESWREPQLFLAARLAQKDAYGTLQHCIGERMRRDHADPDSEERSTYLSVAMLAEADAAFCPAPELEQALIDRMSRFVGLAYRLGEKLTALLSLIPRPAALHLAMALLHDDKEARDWLGANLPGQEGDPEDVHDTRRKIRAACVAAVWPSGDRQLLRVQLDDLIDRVSEQRVDEYLPDLAPLIEEVYGRARAVRFLRELSIDNTRLVDSWGMSLSILNSMEEVGFGDVARTVAFETLRHSPIDARHTADFAGWLLSAGDDEALSAYDAYLRRIRHWLADEHNDVREGAMSYQPLWPARDSDAAHALRLEVLRHRDLAWFVLREAIRDPRYAVEARAAWLDNVRNSFDESRRGSLVYDMAREPDGTLAAPLLLESFRGNRSILWQLERAVRRLIDLGLAREARERLTELQRDETLPSTERAFVAPLIALCDDRRG